MAIMAIMVMALSSIPKKIVQNLTLATLAKSFSGGHKLQFCFFCNIPNLFLCHEINKTAFRLLRVLWGVPGEKETAEVEREE